VKISVSGLVDGSVDRRSGYIQEVAVALEELGFSAFRQPDHVAFFRSVDSRYPYASSGTAPMRDDQGFLAPLLVLQLAGTVTTRLRLGTAVEVGALREPIARAKEIATLDVLTDGRVEYGVGLGWMREEFEACGVPFESRAKRTDEFIGACKALWTQDEATFVGEFFDFRDVVAFPKPVQRPHPPVQVGGNSPGALRRAATLGDAWYGWNMSIEELDHCLDALDEALRAAGRERGAYPILVGVPNAGGAADDLTEYARALRDRRVDEMVIGLGLSRRSFRAQFEGLASLIDD
jgi:probable F420-dependent oxidoreductase